MAKKNLSLTEAARLTPGERVIFDPDNLECQALNPNMLKGLQQGSSYVLQSKTIHGFKRHASVPSVLTWRDFDPQKVTNRYGKPFTNVCLQLEGVEGNRCYCYFRASN